MNAKQQPSPLAAAISADIRSNGPLPFVDFMEYCLYAPGHGYYASERAIFGRQGDFVTAPELGSLFAGCVARCVHRHTRSLAHYDLLEVGAGSGKLACDLLQALDKLDHLPQRYCILERSSALRKRQQQTLQSLSLPVKLEWLEQPPQHSWQGMVIANEVLDALPVERFCVNGKGIHRWSVDHQDGHFEWCMTAAPPAVEQAVSNLRQRLKYDHAIDWPFPYNSEICLELDDFIADLVNNLTDGSLLMIDYGYRQHEYYHPQRHMGTLVCHHAQQGHFDPLANPGIDDISAFVDFTAVQASGERCGLLQADYNTQSGFLIEYGIETVMQAALAAADQKQALALSHEMKQLMLPAEMGEKFKVLRLY